MNAAGTHLILGGDSGIGAALRQRLEAEGIRTRHTSRRATMRGAPGVIPLDLSDADAVRAFAIPPGTARVYLLAGVTSLEACRREPAETRRMHVEHTAQLAERAAGAGAVAVMVSTNLVFDGSRPCRAAADAVCPGSEYGRQKAALEPRVLDAGGVVLRPTKVLPPEPPLLAGWRDALRRGERVWAYEDLWFAPVPLRAVVEALIGATPGLTQVSGDRDVSYHEAALHVARRVGAEPALVRRGSAAGVGVPAEHRPRHTTLRADAPSDVLRVIDEALGL